MFIYHFNLFWISNEQFHPSPRVLCILMNNFHIWIYWISRTFVGRRLSKPFKTHWMVSFLHCPQMWEWTMEKGDGCCFTKCLECSDWNGFFWCSKCGHSWVEVQYLIYWHGLRVCDVLFCFVFEAQHQTQPASHQQPQVKQSGRWCLWCLVLFCFLKHNTRCDQQAIKPSAPPSQAQWQMASTAFTCTSVDMNQCWPIIGFWIHTLMQNQPTLVAS